MTATSQPNQQSARWLSLLGIVLLVVLALPALWPLFTHGYPSTDDGDIHLMRQALLDYHVRHGDWYPRWTAELFLGYGYPVFNFYGPATYYLSELLIIAGLPIAQAMVVASGLLVLVGGVGMFLLATDYFSLLVDRKNDAPTRWLPNPFWGGLVAGVAYTYAPYFLANLYVRGALAELGAMALWPWVIWSCRRLLTDPQPGRYIFVTALIIGLMTITHTITLLLLPPLLLAYALLLFWLRRREGRARPYLVSFGATLAIAMGISAFFWLPLLVERGDLSRLAYNARFMPGHFWDWNTILDDSFRFVYTGHPPHQLGLVQLGLVLVGLFSFWQLGRESRFWLLVAALALLAIGRLTQPLWTTNDIGLTIQFPWRLLSIVSFIFALITGAGLGWLRRPWLQVCGAGLLIALLIVGNWPRPTLLDFRTAQDIDVTLDVVATFEKDAQAWGAGWSREFLPRWAEDFVRVETTTRWEWQSIFAESAATVSKDNATQQSIPQIELTDAAPYRLTFTATSAVPTELRVNQLYFPGWRAIDSAGQPLPVKPSPGFGLLTIELPAGEQQISLSREDTVVEQGATWITIATLLGCLGWLLFKARRFGQALVALLLVSIALGGQLKPVTAASASFTATTAMPYPGLQLIGYRVEVDRADGLLLFPYWLIHNAMPDLQMAWQLIDTQGSVVSSTTAQPYYDTVPASVWTVGTLARDAYRLPLPPDLPAGSYQLALHVQPVQDAEGNRAEDNAPVQHDMIGVVTVQTQTAPAAANQPLALTFTQPAQVKVWLDGYTIDIEPSYFRWRRRPTLAHHPLAYPGDRLVSRLYWRAETAAAEGYHGFIHLVDHDRQTLVAQDQLAGSALNSSLTWNQYRATGETYTLLLPPTAASGLYYPRLGLYTFAERARFTITGADGTTLGDGYDLPPIKVVNPQDVKSLQPALVTYGEFAQLLDVTITPESAIKAGETLTVSLTYQAKTSTPVNYTQFLHIARTTATETIMAAQFDRQPRQGANPTGAWVPGEVVTDQIELTIAEGSPAGRYQLLVGLYDGEGKRLDAYGADGKPFPNAAAILDAIEVE